MCVCSKTLLILFTTPVVESILIIIKGCNYINNEDIVPFIGCIVLASEWDISYQTSGCQCNQL